MKVHNIDSLQNLPHIQLDLLKKRRSPVAFSEKEVTKDQLEQIFEATRWAASCFNGQP